MNEQPEALRLADLIQSRYSNELNDDAADELRRLHAENERLREALKDCASHICGINGREDHYYQQAKDEIKQEQPR